MNTPEIRRSSETDRHAIAQLHRDAFGEPEGESIAQLVLALLDDPTAQPCLSLVADDAGQIVGHVMFTPVTIDGADIDGGYIMAPLAVMPALQKQGLGRALIADGIARLSADDAAFVLVLGDPDYYTRHGFRAGHRLRPPHELPYPEAWLVHELRPGALTGIEGTVTCATSLQAPEHW